MAEKLSREELIDLIESIMTVRDKKTGKQLSEQEHTDLVVKFEHSIHHPGGSDLIYYPELVGLPPEPTAEQIADFAMSVPSLKQTT